MRIGFLTALLFVPLCVLCADAGADLDGERGALARLAQELSALEPMIRVAEAQSGSGRVSFRYDWLRQDLARIKLGIQAHISAPRSVPRTVEPLRGDYRR